ncbi:hypothetical protein B3C1_18944 [Gallaecimonas xiamenensis 3-C-1]|uniref:Uncharacterized protein n=1 Tax=Gallaecimonas xiamenensis 3-C-1 TaxID=745411 RepID=K2J9X8_9GAMM|nr:hypothetical protein B3C1_18944 [Gallaecimonas xiamenensis 3-C-1]
MIRIRKTKALTFTINQILYSIHLFIYYLLFIYTRYNILRKNRNIFENLKMESILEILITFPIKLINQ